MECTKTKTTRRDNVVSNILHHKRARPVRKYWMNFRYRRALKKHGALLHQRQVLLDFAHKDLRRARAGAMNIIPTTSGAAKAVALVIPNLKGKLNGLAFRVPTPVVSVVDLTASLVKRATAEEINKAFEVAAAGPMKGILGINYEPLVSSDYKGMTPPHRDG